MQADRKRVKIRQFHKGLWLNGGPDGLPEGTMRRLFGVGRNLDGLIQSALPMQAINSIGGENGYMVFADALYQATGEDIYRNTVLVPLTAAFEQNGDRLTFLKMKPYIDFPTDYLFVAGGGKLLKFDEAGDFTDWGIPAPPDGFLAENTGHTVDKVISDVDAVGVGEWNEHGTDPTPVVETSISFDAALDCVNQSANGTVQHMSIENLSLGGISLDEGSGGATNVSSEEDFIQVYFRINDAMGLLGIEIEFSIADNTFNTGTLTRRIPIDNVPGAAITNPQGIARIIKRGRYGTYDLYDNDGHRVATNIDPQNPPDIVVGVDREMVRREGVGTPAEDQEVLKLTGTPTIPRKSDTWFQIRVPKSSFTKGGEVAADWNDIHAVRLTAELSRDIPTADVEVYWGQLSLKGGTGMMGKYEYQVTFYDSVTGHRSNPNPTPVVLEKVDRNSVNLTFLPGLTAEELASSGVTHVEVWRTVGHGEIVFKAAEVGINVDTYLDLVADFPGMFTGEHLEEADFPEYLQETELQFNNQPPEDTYDFVVSAPFAGRAWWVADSEHRDRAYYSPVGRPQAVDDFVVIGTSDDPTMAGAVWNDVLYVFTQQRIFRISGEDTPFLPAEVFGAPGTFRPYTVIPTPFGIFYQAVDGIRLFDGSGSRLVGYEQIAPLFLNQAPVETVTPFTGEVACWGEDEYFVSNGSYILVYRPQADRWRLLHVPAQSLYANRDDLKPVLSVEGFTLKMEDNAGSVTIPMQVQTPTYRSSVDSEAVVKFVFLDIDTRGQNVIVQLVFYNEEATLLGIVNTSDRQQVELVAGFPTRVAGVRLIAVAPAEQITIWGIEMDIYEPCMEGAA